ncbi:MAG: tRNA lysidine(34) synthetase TilS [Chthoniobacterales bacterium]
MKLLKVGSRLARDFPPDKRYLIGVSGGRDSVALLDQLVDLGYRNLIVCHLNHQLRGRSSDADARFVRNLAERYRRKIVGRAQRPPNPPAGKRGVCPTTNSRTGQRGARPARNGCIDFELGTANVHALAAKKKMSIETAAREARYAFFAKIAKRRKCRTIFLAHHADDLVETFLFNLLRGAGMTGLAAMRELSTRRIDDVDLTIVRPLLGVWRDEIDHYVRERRLKFREDASNKDLGPARNRLRRRIVPYLEKTFGRNLRRNIWRTAVILAEEENFFELFLPEKFCDVLDAKLLRELPLALQRRMLSKWLRSEKVRDVGFDLVERARALLDHVNRVAKTNLPRDRHLRRRVGELFIEP